MSQRACAAAADRVEVGKGRAPAGSWTVSSQQWSGCPFGSALGLSGQLVLERPGELSV